MTVTYKLVRIEANQPEKTVELSSTDLDYIYLGLEDYYSNIQYNDLDTDVEEKIESEVSQLLYKLGDI